MTLKQLIKKAQFDYINLDIIQANFPAQKLRGKVQLVHFNRDIESEEAIKELAKQNLQPANLYELLDYAIKNPDYQEFIVALGSVWQDRIGSRRVPYRGLDVSRRGLCLDLGWFGGGWGARCRFAAVPIGTTQSLEPIDQEFRDFDPSDIEISYKGKKYKLQEI